MHIQNGTGAKNRSKISYQSKYYVYICWKREMRGCENNSLYGMKKGLLNCAGKRVWILVNEIRNKMWYSKRDLSFPCVQWCYLVQIGVMSWVCFPRRIQTTKKSECNCAGVLKEHWTIWKSILEHQTRSVVLLLCCEKVCNPGRFYFVSFSMCIYFHKLKKKDLLFLTLHLLKSGKNINKLFAHHLALQASLTYHFHLN